ncbi:hypothetical protein [Novipirellula artificiosorum]|uniref:Transmembrane protein n=1 Tax=Novipirellula artificiosorum TaxID=2528016 RepID=A0A5C6D886_9BACT|nr:hypothetical protein [Novipirellula artificiosorum]TWU32988.1 hypothetical protein Poly41_53670 [Novipirellula artificiosorum]
MSDSHRPERFSHHHEAPTELERLIQSAGRYVHPSEDHRPRTLEAAQQQCENLKAQETLGRFFACAMLLFLVSVPVLGFLDTYRPRFQGPTSSELQQKASAFSLQANVGPQWGMYEAFSQWRRDQAEQFGTAP